MMQTYIPTAPTTPRKAKILINGLILLHGLKITPCLNIINNVLKMLLAAYSVLVLGVDCFICDKSMKHFKLCGHTFFKRQK